MKKLNLTFNEVWISALLLSMVSMHSMEKEYAQLASQAEEYNEHYCQLTSLPPEKLIQILSHCLVQTEDQLKSFEDSVETFIRLNSTCKIFNRLLTLEEISDFFKNYTQIDKDTILQNFIETMGPRNYYSPNRILDNYTIKRIPALLLVYAGANVNIKVGSDSSGTPSSLLHVAVMHDDAQFVATLFKYHADSQATDGIEEPIFWLAKTVEIAQLFIGNGVDLHAVNSTLINPDPNVLWHIIDNEIYPSELMALYLKNHVNAKPLYYDKFLLLHNAHPESYRQGDNYCLLHTLSWWNSHKKINNIDDFLKKGELLLNAIPDMINTLNENGKTPLDVAQEGLKNAKTPEAFKGLIVLLRMRGALTAQELTAQTVSLEQLNQ